MAAHTVLLTPARTSQFRLNDVTCVNALVEHLEQAWNRGDADAFAAPFTEGADFVDANGVHVEGRANIAYALESGFHSIYRGSTVEFQLIRMRVIGEGVAVGHLREFLYVPQGQLWGGHDSARMLVLVRTDGRWKVAAMQSTAIPDPMELPVAASAVQ
jgi:uncharacterized protein (TIGR02246 family)